MKILPILLINLVVVGGGLVIYDQMRTDVPTTTYEAGGMDAVDHADLVTRLERLESGSAEPVIRGGGDENLLRRLEALEGRLNTAAPASAASDGGESSTRTDGPAAPSPITVVGENGPNDVDVRNFRRLQDASNKAAREEREREQLTKLLERLEITMDDKQTDQYLSARRDRQKQMGEVFRNLRRGEGVDREQMMEQINAGRTKINDEFAIVINKFLPSGDAAKLVESEGQNRWGGGMRGRSSR